MDAETLKELFREFAPVSVRRMFGGQGVFVDALMIALVSDDVIYLKADEDTIPGFKKQNLKPFSYKTKDGKRTLTSYWRMPDFLYDDPGDLALWARAAHGVALRAEERGRKPKAAAKKKSATRTGPKKTKARKSAEKKKRKAVRRPSMPRPKRPRGRSRT